jgi:photosystem II stability/assembly factor-like uncharacterized protein
VGDLGALLKTTDGGGRWEQRPGCGGQNLNAVHFPEPSIGYAAGMGGRVCKTEDGGDTWYPRQSGTGRELRALRFLDAARGYAVGEQGTILSTGDGGASWERHASGTVIDLQSVYPTEAAVHAIGNAGIILKSEGLHTGAVKPRGGKARSKTRNAASRQLRFDQVRGRWVDVRGKTHAGREPPRPD